MNFRLGILMFIVASTVVACALNDLDSESTFNDTDSHYVGTNCMDCHISGEKGTGWFTIAGSVYDQTQESPYVNAEVSITKQPNGGGNEVMHLFGDARGNFYTTFAIDFGEGLYVSVVGRDGQIRHMKTPIKDGSCNRCHGVTTNKLWLE